MDDNLGAKVFLTGRSVKTPALHGRTPVSLRSEVLDQNKLNIRIARTRNPNPYIFRTHVYLRVDLQNRTGFRPEHQLWPAPKLCSAR